MLESYPDVLVVSDICKVLHIGRTKAYELVRTGQIRSVRIGSSIRIPKTLLLDYICQIGYTGDETGRHRHLKGGEDESNG